MSAHPRRFGQALHDLLLGHEQYLTQVGNVNLQRFARDLPSYQYETLRKAATGEREPTLELIEEVASVLGVDPGVFYEYGLLRARRSFDPREVGLEAALENLNAWEQLEASRKAGPGADRGSKRRRGPAGHTILAGLS